MTNSTITNNRGIALLITLAVITLLIAVGIEINRKVRSYVAATYTNRNHMALVHLASSGTNAAMAILVKDRQESDTDALVEAWADPEKIAAVLDDIPFENGKVALVISDELSRIQVNALVEYPGGHKFNDRQRIIWEQLLHSFSQLNEAFEEIDSPTIINSAKDWIDSGDDEAITGLTGAESDYYQGLDPPYTCRNSPFLHITELGLVRGVSKELLHGTDQTLGILDYLTVFGVSAPDGGNAAYAGKINLNTADPVVIAAILPLEHKEKALSIFDYRQQLIEADNVEAFKKPDWYKDAPGCSEIKIDPDLLTVSSDLFRIEATAVLGDASLVVITRVRREKQKKTGRWTCNTLQWEIK